MSGECLIAYGNRVAAASLYGGGWTTSMPLSLLQNRQLELKARSLDLNPDNTQFVAEYPLDNPINSIALANHNLSLSARYRVRYTNDPALLTFDYDSGWLDVWPPVFNSYDLDWGDPNWWSGRYLEEDRAGYVWTTVHNLPVRARPLYWVFNFNDPENVNGFVEFGRLFQGASWQPSHNMDTGASLGLETSTEVSVAHSGAEFFDVGTPYRVMRFVTNGIKETEAMSKVFEIQRRSGIDKEVLVMWSTTDTLHALRRQFLGRLRKLDPIEWPQMFVDGDLGTKAAWEVKESIP